MLILASKSPRRKEICELLRIEFKIIPAENEIPLDLTVLPEKAVERVAEGKAREVFIQYPNDVIIGADTAVYVDNVFLGKPKNAADAYSMLKMLSGKTHSVITGVSVMSKEKTVTFSSVAMVEFAPLSDEEINYYISTHECDDKAGAYAVQGIGARFIKGIQGDFYTVMGLPCQKLYEVLKKENIC
jgi:septum formation protein